MINGLFGAAGRPRWVTAGRAQERDRLGLAAMAYLDHAATTPMLPEAVEAYVAAAGSVGNASSLHAPGPAAPAALVEEARERIAAALGARPSEVIFTGGGTESDNLAVKGIFWARRDGRPRGDRVVASARRAPRRARRGRAGWAAPRAPRSPGCRSTPHGRVAVDALREELDRHGDEIARGHRDVGQQRGRHACSRWPSWPRWPPSAACRSTPTRSRRSARCRSTSPPRGAAALTVTGHKLGGPTGVGALLLGRDVACTPLLHGGGQERDVRSGTLDVAGITAFAVAVEMAVKGQAEFATRVGALRDELVARVRAAVPDAVLNGDPVDRLPGNAHFSFPGCEGDALLLLLDAQGIACSTGSACSAGHGPAVARAAGDGGRRARWPGPRCASPSATRPRWTTWPRWPRPCRPRSSGPAGPGATQGRPAAGRP